MTQQVVKHKLDTITFGKHKGKTFRWMIEHDPSYVVWLHDNKVVEMPEEWAEDALWSDADNSPPEDFFWRPD